MAVDVHAEEELTSFESGFDAAESGDDLTEGVLSEDLEEESDDSELEADGGVGDSQSGDADPDMESASDQILPEGDEVGVELNSQDTNGSEADQLAEDRDLLDRYFGDSRDEELQPEGASPELVVASDDIKDDVADILRINPQYEKILLEDSEQGQRIRANLHEFGPEAAVPMMEAIHQTGETNARFDAVASKRQEYERKVHYDSIGKEHPDYVGLIGDPAKKQEFKTYVSKVTAWVENLPYKEAKEALRVMDSGNASEVSGLLTNYKKANSGRKPDRVNRQAARDVIAVPGKRKAARNSASTEKSFEGGFKAALEAED